MLIPPDVIRTLEDAGATVRVRADPSLDAHASLEVRLDGTRHRFAAIRAPQRLFPSTVAGLDAIRLRVSKRGLPLLLLDHASESLGKALITRGWSWADEDGNFELKAPGLWLRQRLDRRVRRPRPSPILPRGGGGLAIVRLLISRLSSDEPLRTVRIAQLIGVTQARASQVLVTLERAGLVERRDGLRGAKREALLDLFLEGYRGPGGRETYLYALDPPHAVARDIASAAGTEVLISADVGPDVLAPWRAPTHLVVYAKRPLPLEDLGTVPAEGRGDANLIVREPADTSLFAVGPIVVEVRDVSIPLVDPTQMLWDLRQLGGEDRAAQAEKLRAWLLSSR